MIRALEELGIQSPTPVQKQVMPFLIEKGADLIAQAQTGTGKTAAFGLPLLMKMDHSRRDIQGLVLAPTRELAKQIGKQLFRFTKYTDKVFTEVLGGGDNIDQQIEKGLREDDKRWIAARNKIDALYKGRPRPQYIGELPEGHDGLGLGLKCNFNHTGI